MIKQHDWALSWPGNYCRACGSDDMMETALGLNLIDPCKEGDSAWVNQEVKAYFEFLNDRCVIDALPEELAEYEKETDRLLTPEVKRLIRGETPMKQEVLIPFYELDHKSRGMRKFSSPSPLTPSPAEMARIGAEPVKEAPLTQAPVASTPLIQAPVDSTELEEARELAYDLFHQACCVKMEDGTYKYEHQCMRTYEYAQDLLIKWGKIKKEECLRP